jgi:hypothetical protein
VTRHSLPRPLAAAGGAVLVVAAALMIAGGAGAAPPPGEPPIGGAISEQDRKVLATVPVERGAPPAPVDPSVDLTDPEAVARAYLSAARSVRPDDSGHTHLRAAGYAMPGSAAASVGVIVIDPPPAGSVRTATVTGLTLIAANGDDSRRGYRAEIGTATGPPGGPVAVDMSTTYVVLARQPDRRWLVTAESEETPDLPTGER